MPAIDNLNNAMVIPNGKEPKIDSPFGVSRQLADFTMNDGDIVHLDVSNSDSIIVLASNLLPASEIVTAVTIDPPFELDDDGKPVFEGIEVKSKKPNPDAVWIESFSNGAPVIDSANQVGGFYMVRFDTRNVNAVQFEAATAAAVRLKVNF